MGLDMYAYRVSKKNRISEVEFKFDENDVYEFFYWRKHHDLHGWMEKLYYAKGGEDDNFNCVPVELTLEDLDKLERDIKNRKLPHTEGFFFGNFPPDDDSDKNDFLFIEQARDYIKKGYAVYYNSWW